MEFCDPSPPRHLVAGIFLSFLPFLSMVTLLLWLSLFGLCLF